MAERLTADDDPLVAQYLDALNKETFDALTRLAQENGCSRALAPLQDRAGKLAESDDPFGDLSLDG